MKNNRLESRSYDEVVSKQPFVGYQDKIVSITESVDATSERLRALRWFSLNLLRDHENRPSISLAEQLHAAFIPASHWAHIFLSHDYLLAIRETIRIPTLFSILKERENLNGGSSVDV